METPDILAVAREAVAARTDAKVVVLSPGRGDFRLDGRGVPCFSQGEGLTPRVHNGKIYVDIGGIWYDRAVAAWNEMEVCVGWSEEADAHLCARLLARPVLPQSADERHWPLIRLFMHTPYTLRTGAHRDAHIRQCARLLRQQFADSLARQANLYALRGCAAMLARAMGEQIPVDVFSFGGTTSASGGQRA